MIGIIVSSIVGIKILEVPIVGLFEGIYINKRENKLYNMGYVVDYDMLQKTAKVLYGKNQDVSIKKKALNISLSILMILLPGMFIGVCIKKLKNIEKYIINGLNREELKDCYRKITSNEDELTTLKRKHYWNIFPFAMNNRDELFDEEEIKLLNDKLGRSYMLGYIDNKLSAIVNVRNPGISASVLRIDEKPEIYDFKNAESKDNDKRLFHVYILDHVEQEKIEEAKKLIQAKRKEKHEPAYINIAYVRPLELKGKVRVKEIKQ